MGTKREREGRGLPRKVSKRAKVQEGSTVATDAFVGIDQLEWKEVQLPDRLGDVGGFFGLEEIDGVDIVRPNANGQIKFKVSGIN
jgi:ATP-dependent RNA helicase DDX24/MAK5